MNRRLVPTILALLASISTAACSGSGTSESSTSTSGPASESTDVAASTTGVVADPTDESTATAPTTTGAPRPATDAVVGEVRTTTVGDFRAVIPPEDCPTAATTTTEALPNLTRPSQPTVEVPKSAPTELVVTDLVEGTGTRKATTGDAVTFYYVGVTSPDGTELESNYSEDSPYTTQLGVDENLPGWTQGMEGVTAGTRRQIDIPANLALGDTGSDQIPPGTSLTFVIDVVAVRPGPPMADGADEPKATFPATPDTDLIAFKTERLGDRCVIAEPGDQVYLNVKVVDAKSGDTIESSWDRGRAAIINLDAGGFPGLVEAAIGMGVGEVRSVTLTPSTAGEPSAAGGSTTITPGAQGLSYLVEFVGFT